MPERRYHRGVVDREHEEYTSREEGKACEPDTLRQQWKGGMRPKSEKLRDRAQRIVSRAAERDEITTFKMGADGRSAANRAEMPRAARKLEESASKARWREQRLADMGKRRSRKAADA